MTAVMRAVTPPTGSRALRAALVRGGKMVDERIVPAGEHLTVGPTERSTFVVAGLGASVRLLEWSRAGYRLHLEEGMSGRVSVGGEITEVGGKGARPAIALDDEARGKVVVGDAMVLFHFVALPAAAARPQLPLAARQSAFDGLDWKTTCIAAFSFLFHFGAMGTAYADFTDSTIDDDGARLTQTLGSLHQLPAILPDIEDHTNPATSTDAASRAEAKHTGGQASGKTARSGPPKASSGGSSGGGRTSDVRARQIADDLARESGAIALAIGGAGGSATDRVLEHGETPMGLLDGAARDAGGTRMGGVLGLNTGGGGFGPVRPGERSGGLPGSAEVKREVREGDTGIVVAPKRPPGRADVAPPEPLGGDVPDAPRTVGGLKGMLRTCYRHAQDEDPNMRGSVRVTARIAPNGDVTSVQAANSGLSAKMVACVTRVVRGAQFSPSPNGGAVAIPMTFIPQ
jgi:hypothetical protein